MVTPPVNAKAAPTRKAVAVAFATQYVEMGIQFVSVIVLVRLLSPGEIGAFSVSALLMGMLHVFRDFGVTQFIIQERELTRDKLRAAMGVAIILALAVAAVLAAISGSVARFYDNPPVQGVLLVMAASFAISPFGSVLLGVLRRDGALTAIFYIKTSSAVCQVATAIGLALAGYGALSLAWANFAGILAFGVAANLARPQGMPWLPRFRQLRQILAFGSVSSLGNLAGMAGNGAPELVIGRVLNMAAVGYFSRATGIVQLFRGLIGNALSPLVLPYFAQVRREQKPLAAPYLRAVSYLTALGWPFFACLFVLAFPVVRILSGPNWDASVPIVRLLCIGGLLSTVTLFATQAMVASGAVRSATLCSLLVQPVRIGLVLAAAAHGLQAVAAALIAADVVALAVTSWFIWRVVGAGPGDLLRACGASALATLAALPGPLLAWLAWGDAPATSWPPLVLGGLGAALGWLGALWLSGHPLGEQLLPILRLKTRRATGVA